MSDRTHRALTLSDGTVIATGKIERVPEPTRVMLRVHQPMIVILDTDEGKVWMTDLIPYSADKFILVQEAHVAFETGLDKFAQELYDSMIAPEPPSGTKKSPKDNVVLFDRDRSN